MKVLMQNRVDAFSNIGGDTVQMIKTKEELEQLGVSVDISLDLEPDLTDYDLVHLFNVTRIHETWMQFKNAKKQGKKVVLSTIHHKKSDIEEYEKKALTGIPRLIKRIFSNEESIQLFKTFYYTIQSRSSIQLFLKQLTVGFINQQKEVIKGSDLLLPNSQMEMDAIIEDFGLKNEELKSYVIPNGVEFKEINLNQDENLFLKKYKIDKFIFCPGRIEPRKNQLNIMKALQDSGLKVVFAGAINKKHRKYYKEFIKKINENENFYYVGLLDREMMFSAYKLAKVSILGSWFETTGLIGLEAAINECNVVITEKGYTREYYKEYANYCNPDNIESIKNAVINSYNSKFNDEFKSLAINEYTWNKAAKITKKAYEEL